MLAFWRRGGGADVDRLVRGARQPGPPRSGCAHRRRGGRAHCGDGHRGVGRLARLHLPVGGRAGRNDAAGSGGRCCVRPRTAWPDSGRSACTPSWWSPTTSPWRSGRHRIGSIRPGSSASPRAERQSVVAPLRSVAAGSGLQSLAQGRLRPHAGAPGDAGDERHHRPAPGATDPDAGAVGDVVGHVDGDGAHGVALRRRPPIRGAAGTTRARAEARRVRRNTSPSTKAGAQARVNEASAGSAERVVPPPAICVATPTGSRTRPRSRRASTTMDADSAARPAPAGGPAAGPRRAATSRRHAPAPRLPVPPAQRAGRRPVEGAAGQEVLQRGRALVGDRAGRDVAHVPARLVQAPDQVHVLAAAERRVEEVGALGHIGPDQEGRARHEGNAAPRAAPALPRSPRSSDDRGARARSAPGGDDARRHGGHQGVVEVAQQRPEPSIGRARSRSRRTRRAAVHRGQPGVARAGRPDVGRQPHEGGTVALGDLLGRPGVGRRVVDHDAGQPVLQCVEEAVELLGPVAHRHHDGDVGRARGVLEVGLRG